MLLLSAANATAAAACYCFYFCFCCCCLILMLLLLLPATALTSASAADAARTSENLRIPGIPVHRETSYCCCWCCCISPPPPGYSGDLFASPLENKLALVVTGNVSATKGAVFVMRYRIRYHIKTFIHFDPRPLEVPGFEQVYFMRFGIRNIYFFKLAFII